VSKETYPCEKDTQRHVNIEKDRVHVKRDECMSKETCLCQKRHSHVKRANLGENDRVARDLRPHVKRDLYMSNEKYSCQKTPIHVKQDMLMPKETYTCPEKSVHIEKNPFT